MVPPRVLVFGGNGGIGRSMTRVMLARSWHVTSVVRNSSQKEGILQLGGREIPKTDVFVTDLQNMSQQDASRIIEDVRPDYVVFAAGSMTNPNAVDRDAAKRIIKSSTSTPSVTKFLMISFPASRRKRAPWWDDSDYENYLNEKNSYPEIAKAKLVADEYLVAMAKARETSGGPPFQAISLRPSWLTDSPKGKVDLGQTKFLGQVSRADVAEVAVDLLRSNATGWFDLLEGSVEIKKAVDQVVRDGISSIKGEDLTCIYKLADA